MQRINQVTSPLVGSVGRRPSKRCGRWLRPSVVVAAVLACLAIALPVGSAQGDPTELLNEGLLRLDSIEAGALLFETSEPGWYVPAPTLHTDIDIAISGPIARTTVAQRFHNDADVFVEGKYVFPLPEGSAVDSLRMRVGDRWIQGQIEEKEQAKLIYEEAKANGQVASLVEQLRPNVFTTSVANIAPDADVVIQIQYQESLAPRGGVFGMRIPLVVAPRYVPEDQASYKLQLSSDGWLAETNAGPDGERVLSPVVDPRSDGQTMRNPVEISIDLDAGFPLGDVTSPYHDIDVERRIETSAEIEISGPVPADRDFYLSWKPRDLTDPYGAAFIEQRDGDTHFVTMLTPPSQDAIADTRQPREVIFVQDTSGSMGGASIAQAKAGLTLALERLNEGDVFNIIEFNAEFTRFSNKSVTATPTNITRGIEFVDALVADGGTEMLPALKTALDDRDAVEGRLRQVVFLTDGAVSNELQMLQLIERDLGSSRLFTVGIGSAPNSYFMTAAAKSGRGSFVFIGDLNEVRSQMETLFAKIETPAVVGIEVKGLPTGVEVSPWPIPDLYAGDPVVLTVRAPQGTEVDQLELTGTRAGQGWDLKLALYDAEIRPGVSKLWAGEHIRGLEALRVSPQVDEDRRNEIDDEVLSTALEFGLVSRLTSLVAVDVEVTRPSDASSTSTAVATNLPAGWDPEIFIGDPVSDADGSTELSNVQLDRLAEASSDRVTQAEAGAGVPFAATGADWQIRAVIGVGLLVAGLAGFGATGRRKQPA